MIVGRDTAPLGEEEIIQALRLADGYQKRSLAYIETILRNRQNYEQ